MKKHFAIVLALGALMSGQAAWADCTVAKITGNNWRMIGTTIYDTEGTVDVRHVWCQNVKITAGSVPNRLRVHGSGCKGSTKTGPMDYQFGDVFTVDPKTCRVTGRLGWFNGGLGFLEMRINSANFQNPQGTANSADANFVGELIAGQAFQEGERIGSMAFTLMR